MIDATARPITRRRLAGPVAILLTLLAALPATAMLTGCDTALRRSERAFVFPDALMNADLGPRRVARNDWDPFGWGGTPDAGTDDDHDAATRYASASPRPHVEASARPARADTEAPRRPEPSQPATTAQASPATATAAATPQPAPATHTAPATAVASAGPTELAAPPVTEHYDPAEAAAYVAAVYAVNGVDLSPAARSQDRAPTIVELYRHAYSMGIVYQSEHPATGDLVFFHNTFDRNGDGRWNDWYTLVGVVEAVGADGTVNALAYVDGQVARLHLNVDRPDDDGANTTLRDGSDANGRAGALFAGYANLLGDIPRVTVIDNWQPGMLTARR